MQKNIVSIKGHTCPSHLHLSAATSPAISPREFKDAMAKLAFSICVVTAVHENEQLGRTVTSFMPLSAEPPQIVVSIDVRSRMIDLIGLSAMFSVSFLSAGQATVGDIFAGKAQQDDRFTISDWTHWPSGNPKLPRALISMDCELAGSLDVGDQMLFVGAITEIEICDDGTPLLWNERGYREPA